ncbi:hypothetical protein NPIL_27261, partial [Nephila pilipes]
DCFKKCYLKETDSAFRAATAALRIAILRQWYWQLQRFASKVYEAVAEGSEIKWQ